MRRALVLSLLLLPHMGCDDSNPQFWQRPNDLLPLVALDDRIAYVEKNSETAFILDPADRSFTPTTVRLSKAPVLAVKRNRENQMLVLCHGASGSSTVKAIPAALHVIDAATATDVPYELAGRYDSLAQSADGRFAVLYHSPSQGKGDSGLFNPNEMSIVDFAAPTGVKVTAKSIRSLGGSPERIEFSLPKVFPSGGQRAVTVILSKNYVTILDAANPGDDEISVPLCAQSTGCSFNTQEIAFQAVDDLANPSALTKMNVYVRARNSSDIFQITVAERADSTTAPATAALHASLSMLSVGAPPDAMLLYGSGDAARLAALSSSSKKLVIIDPNTSHTLAITTAISADTIVPFTATTTATPRLQALLVDTQNGSKSVLFADLSQVETMGGLAVTDYPLSAAASNVSAVGDGLVVLVPGRFSNSTAFTVMALASKSSTDIAADSQLGTPYFESVGLLRRMWQAYQSNGLAYLDLSGTGGSASLVTKLLWLDQSVASITALGKASVDGRRYLVVGHPDPDDIGNITFVDADAPSRASARTAYGFLYTNYLERAQP